ncbi:uncharacterized protein ACBT57_005797 [Dama dama]
MGIAEQLWQKRPAGKDLVKKPGAWESLAIFCAKELHGEVALPRHQAPPHVQYQRVVVARSDSGSPSPLLLFPGARPRWPGPRPPAAHPHAVPPTSASRARLLSAGTRAQTELSASPHARRNKKKSPTLHTASSASVTTSSSASAAWGRRRRLSACTPQPGVRGMGTCAGTNARAVAKGSSQSTVKIVNYCRPRPHHLFLCRL